MQGLIYGVLFLVLGILSFTYWWKDFFGIIKGILPLALIVMGLLALSTGISMVRESSNRDGKSDDSSDNIEKE
ncbi:MAG: hypothetical protein ABII27_07740 [bacterium]